MIFIGIFIDLFNWLIPNPNTFFFQFAAFILGTLFIAIGSGTYISAKLGAGPRDRLMLLIVQKTNFNIAIARTIMEVFVAVVGFVLGGPLGLGTVFIAFALGPIIQITVKYSGNLLTKQLQRIDVADGCIGLDKMFRSFADVLGQRMGLRMDRD